MRELGRLYEMTMKFRTISRTRHAGRRARSRQIIKQHGASRSEGVRRDGGKAKRRSGTRRQEGWKETPENFLRRLADFAPQRFPVVSREL